MDAGNSVAIRRNCGRTLRGSLAAGRHSKPKNRGTYGASQRPKLSRSILRKSLVGKRVEFARANIGFYLLIPTLIRLLLQPIGKPPEIVGGQLQNRGLNLLDGDHETFSRNFLPRKHRPEAGQPA